ncbi:nuclear transport factor 2 family protein [Cryptosporangium sp. NPDC051539]|uniref:nuclear transport factor 2 family protein n=1 Tax=Cryptosporangium sp. NPDC051539 TaxID=3363962 RepID=UPI0037BB2FC7
MADLPNPVQALLAAANAHDTEAFLDAFTADGVVDDWGREFTGRAAIQRWSDAEFIGVRVTLEVGTVTRQDDSWTIGATVGGDGFNGPSHFTFDVGGGQIRRMTIRQ